MHDDVKLAGLLLDGAPRILKTLLGRYRDEMEMALEHCRVAVELGLEFDEYGEGVLRSAAESLLHSFPVSKPDASLDPHVHRVLGHRDFGLALLLVRGVEDAWRVFGQRYGNYIRSLFIRDGLSYDESQKRLELLIESLADANQGAPPIAGYRGSVDLNNWLYCYVRANDDVPVKHDTPHVEVDTPPSYVLPLVLHEEDLREHITNEFVEAWKRLAREDRALLQKMSAGTLPYIMPARGEVQGETSLGDPKAVIEKHATLVKDLSQDLRKRVVSHYRGLVSATVVEEAIINVMTAELMKQLTPIVGTIEMDREGMA